MLSLQYTLYTSRKSFRQVSRWIYTISCRERAVLYRQTFKMSEHLIMKHRSSMLCLVSHTYFTIYLYMFKQRNDPTFKIQDRLVPYIFSTYCMHFISFQRLTILKRAEERFQTPNQLSITKLYLTGKTTSGNERTSSIAP